MGLSIGVLGILGRGDEESHGGGEEEELGGFGRQVEGLCYGWAWGKLACAGWPGGGGHSSPPKEGGGSRKGALVTGQSQEASLKPLLMTHQLRHEAAWKFFLKKFPP